MAVYEIHNPSDPVTVEANDLAVARTAALLLGRGAYWMTDEHGDEVLPMFVACDFKAWADQHEYDLSQTMLDRRQEIIACLSSALCCTPRERPALAALMGDDRQAREQYNEARRSSINDICGQAYRLADADANTYRHGRKGEDAGASP